MIKKRLWSVDEKLSIVLEGIGGDRIVAEICREHGISQPQFYKWRNRFFEGGKLGLTRASGGKEKEFLKKEIGRLQQLVGKMALEIEMLKRSDEFLGR